MINDLVIGTGNAGKLKEFTDLFSDSALTVRGLKDFPEVKEPVEDGATFLENAKKKARGYASLLKMPVLADDSGLCVQYLKGAPGVFSARFAGENATDSENIDKLLKKLEGVPDEDRSARFECVIAISMPDGSIIFTAEGTCDGRITHKPFGINGFGYDPVFIPNGYQDTFGILEKSIKRGLSHRAIAARKIKTFLQNNSKNPT